MTDMANGEGTTRAAGSGPETLSPRERLIEAFMALLGEQGFERVGLRAVADRAGVALDEFRGEFGSTYDVLAAFVAEIDRAVLAGIEPADADSTVRERLFDLLMRRFELLLPYRPAIESLRDTGLRVPPFGMVLNRLNVRTMQWLMAAAGLDSSGLRGTARAQALALLWARVFATWLEDTDPGLARTMAKLDRELATAATWSSRFEELCNFVPRLPCGRFWRRRGYGREQRSPADLPGDEGIPAAAI